MAKRRAFNITVYDVEADGFPSDHEQEAGRTICFVWDGDVYTGWPLIDADNSYPGNSHFATPEQAKAAPLNVLWEASEDRVAGTFSGVRHWFRMPRL